MVKFEAGNRPDCELGCFSILKLSMITIIKVFKLPKRRRIIENFYTMNSFYELYSIATNSTVLSELLGYFILYTIEANVTRG